MALMVISQELFDWNFYCFVLTIVNILTWNHANCRGYSWVLFVNMFYNTCVTLIVTSSSKKLYLYLLFDTSQKSSGSFASMMSKIQCPF